MVLFNFSNEFQTKCNIKALEFQLKTIVPRNDLVNLLDGWAGSSLATSRCSSSCTSHAPHVRHATRSTSGCPIKLGDDGVADSLHLLLLLIELLDLGELVGVQPLDGLVALVVDGLAAVIRDLVLHLLILDGGLHVEAVALQSVLGGDPLLLLFVIRLELLGIVDHLLDFLLGQAALVVGDRDLVLLAGRLVRSGHIEDTVGVNIEGDLNLGNSSGGWRNSGQIELAKVVVVLGGDGGVPLDQRGHHATSSLNSKREGRNIEEKKVRNGLRGVASQDGSLDGGTVGHGLVRVDRLVQILAVEEVLQQLLHLGDPGGATDKDDVVDGRLVHLGVPHRLLNRLEGALEEVRAKLLKSGPGDRGVEVDAFEQGVDLNVSLSRGRQGPLSPLAGSPQPPQGTLVPLHVLLVLPLELVDEVVDHPVVEVLSTQVSVTGSGLDLEDALLDGQDGDIKGAAAKIEDQDVALS